MTDKWFTEMIMRLFYQRGENSADILKAKVERINEETLMVSFPELDESFQVSVIAYNTARVT